MTPTSLLTDILRDRRELVLEEMERRIGALPRSSYQEFLLSPLGRLRLATWLDLLIGAMGGDEERFLSDQKMAGYERALQGFHWGDASKAYGELLESCLAVAGDALNSGRQYDRSLIEDSRRLIGSYFRAYAAIGASFLQTREDIIKDQVSILQKLLEFTKKVIATFEVDAIVDLLVGEISLVFEAETYVAVTRSVENLRAEHARGTAVPPRAAAAMANCLGNAIPFFVDQAGTFSTNIDAFDPKEVVAVPFGIHDRVLGTVALAKPAEGIRFGQKELCLLTQFLHIVSLALENAFMVDKIDQSRRELRLLTGKIMTVREEQRRLLAEDIHDTLAQDLAGIGYTIQYASELARTKPHLVAGELEGLLRTVHQTINQCRQVMSALRPDLIDTLGLVPALRQLIDHFSRESEIAVSAHLPEDVTLSRDVSICLYRVTEEALRNVRKHAAASCVQFSIYEDGEQVILCVSGDGKGFDMTRESPWIRDNSKFGLLYMLHRVEALGGSLTINTGLNAGCAITARLRGTFAEGSLGQNKDHDRR